MWHNSKDVETKYFCEHYFVSKMTPFVSQKPGFIPTNVKYKLFVLHDIDAIFMYRSS